MVVVSWVGAGVMVVDDTHARQSQGVWSHVRRCRSTSRVQGDSLITPDHTAILVRSSWYGRVGFGRSTWNGMPREGSVSLYMQPVGYTPWCSMDMLLMYLIVQQKQ